MESGFRKSLDAAFRHADSYLEGLNDSSVASTCDLDALRARLRSPLTFDGLPPEQVIDELASDVAGGLLGSAGGRFFGWVIGGALPAALAADWLCFAWQQNAALYACSPAAAVVEESLGIAFGI